VVMAVHGMSVRKRRELEVALRAQPWIREVAAVEHGQSYVWDEGGRHRS